MWTRGPRQLNNSNRATPNTRCQRCLKLGHHTFECTNARPYAARPSHSKQLASGSAGKRDEPSVQTPAEFKTNVGAGIADKIIQAKAAERDRLRKLREKEERKAAKRNGAEKRRQRSPSYSDDSSMSDSSELSESSSEGSRSQSPPPRRSRRRDSLDAKPEARLSSRSPPPRRPRSPSPRHGSRAKRRDSRSRSRSPIRRRHNDPSISPPRRRRSPSRDRP